MLQFLKNYHPTSNLQSGAGFTLIELLVVIVIMVTLISVLSINLAGQRDARNLAIAENELVSNIRKIQSYTLSARTPPSGQIAQYYLLKIDITRPQKYTIQAITQAFSQPAVEDMETINLPANIRFAASSPVIITNRLNPATQNIFSSPACAVAAFAAPFGKIILNDGCSPANLTTSPQNLNLSDDYRSKIINFQSNTVCDAGNGNPPIPPVCSASTDSFMIMTLSDFTGAISRRVTINGITGAVSFD